MKSQQQSRRGAISILAAILTIVLVAMVAFSVDIGYVLTAKEEMQRTADAAALAACWEYGLQLSEGQTAPAATQLARTTASEYAASNAGDERADERQIRTPRTMPAATSCSDTCRTSAREPTAFRRMTRASSTPFACGCARTRRSTARCRTSSPACLACRARSCRPKRPPPSCGTRADSALRPTARTSICCRLRSTSRLGTAGWPASGSDNWTWDSECQQV